MCRIGSRITSFQNELGPKRQAHNVFSALLDTIPQNLSSDLVPLFGSQGSALEDLKVARLGGDDEFADIGNSHLGEQL
jgi:hypothetical protein